MLTERLQERCGELVTGRRQRHFEPLLGGVSNQGSDVGPLEGVATGEDDPPGSSRCDLGDDGEGGFRVHLRDVLRTPAVGAFLAALRGDMEVERGDLGHHGPFRRGNGPDSIAAEGG